MKAFKKFLLYILISQSFFVLAGVDLVSLDDGGEFFLNPNLDDLEIQDQEVEEFVSPLQRLIIERRSVEEARFLSRLGVNDVNEDGQTALHLAILYADEDWVYFLLDHGANPNIQDERGETALHLAALIGNLEIVELLLSARALMNVPNLNGEYPILLACVNHHTEVAKYLLSCGAKVSKPIRVIMY